jgi:hypothetical protein
MRYKLTNYIDDAGTESTDVCWLEIWDSVKMAHIILEIYLEQQTLVKEADSLDDFYESLP